MATKKSLGAAGLALIKSFEGCRLTAYKPVPTEKYWTIGWGHYGADVTEGMTITQAQADALLVQDCEGSVAAVNNKKLCPITETLNQNQFDALVSFTFNCGSGGLKTLCANRTAAEIAEKMLLYNKGGGKVLPGLVRRRKAEQDLFNKGSANSVTTTTAVDQTVDTVKDVQFWLNRNFSSGLTVDGLYGSRTKAALAKAFQKTVGVTADGIWGAKTEAATKTHTLRMGASGTLVNILQCCLICHKQKITADGKFGANTEKALKIVQGNYGLKADGIAGVNTFKAMFR
jgi:lysozyme